MKLKNKSKGFAWWLLLLAALLVLGPPAWMVIIRCEGVPPLVELETPFIHIGLRKEASVAVADAGRGLRSLRIALHQGDKEVVLLEKEYPRAGLFKGGVVFNDNIDLLLEPRKLGIGDGDARLSIRAVDYSWRRWFNGNETRRNFDVAIDTRPPKIDVLSQQHNVAQGGAGLIVYRVSKSGVASGVMVDERFFPGYPGYFVDDPNIHLAFFALSHEAPPRTSLYVTAEDPAGNRARAGFYHHIRTRTFKKDNITLPDAFLNRKMPEFEAEDSRLSGLSNLDIFLKVNRELRVENDRVLLDLWRKTQRTILWEGAFIQMPNAANRAGFADQRDYLYRGEVIDKQVHLGVDLASLAASPAPAANRGIVILAEYVGIYGNTVVLDHGFGLLTVYSHLSSLGVSVGQSVEKGESLGRTGATGMAGGDHLHFSVIVHDTFVNPLEWWDPSWVENNVMSKIRVVRGTPDA